MAEEIGQREVWGSRIGLILAAAGNAVGIGNFLRFPSKAATSGGGAFMIPYLCALLFLGIPMMWVAWGIGRHGGKYGHGSTPGMFDKLWKNPISKYLGVLGIAIPLVFAMYYTFAESWQLGYSWLSLTGGYQNIPDMDSYLREYQGEADIQNYIPSANMMLIFFFITFALNIWVMYRGVAKGIELLAKIAMPLLFVFAIVLMIKVLTLGNPYGKGDVLDGLGYVWNPDFSRIAEIGIWIVAAGQIFYTLSIGTGSLECYASYLKENDDVVLNGLTTSATNEFVEVIFGGSISIPVTAAFFGPHMVVPIASKGTFNLGMVAMPEVLRSLGNVQIFGTIWFLLLFVAAFTSSVAVAQPVMAFFQDEMKWKRAKATFWLAVIWLLGSLPCIFFLKFGFFDEIDWWAGTIGLVLFSAIEIIIFAWIFGMDKGWEDMHRGADIRIPRVFYYIMKYVTPLYLIFLLVGWFSMGSAGYEGLASSFSSTIVEKDYRENLKYDAKYPEFDQAWRSSGDEIIGKFQITIDGNGKVTNMVKKDGPDSFAKSIEQKLNQWEYKAVKGDLKAGTFDLMVFARYRKPYIIGAWALMIAVYLIFCGMTYYAWSKRGAKA